MTSLKNEIIGTWELLSYIEVPLSGEDSTFPLGKSAKGILIYSPDGYMSVQISGNNSNSENDLLLNKEPSYDNFNKDSRQYIAFTGKYIVDNEMAHVVYNIESCLYPNWVGSKQTRKLDFEGDILYQKSVEPIISNGTQVYAYMTWKKINKLSLDYLLEDEEVNFS